MLPRPTIEAFDEFLAARGLRLEAVVVGGSALAPTTHELAEAEPWICQQDGHPGWPAHVGMTLAELGGRVGHGV